MGEVVAPGVVRLAPLLDQYSESERRKITFLSISAYLFSALSFAGTIYLYNPENLFGDTLISSPINTVIRPTYTPGCTGLSPYASSVDDFNPVGQGIPPGVLLAADGLITVDIVENTSYIENGSEEFVRYERSDHTPIEADSLLTGEIVRYNHSLFGGSPFPYTAKLNVSFQIAVETPLFLTGDPDECAELFSTLVELNFDPTCFADLSRVTSADVGASSCIVPPVIGVTSFTMQINLPITPRYIITINFPDFDAVQASVGDFYCGTSGGFSILRVAPFSCTEASFRDWLEVLALSFSNAGLFYAVSVTSFFFCLHCGKGRSSSEKMILRPEV